MGSPAATGIVAALLPVLLCLGVGAARAQVPPTTREMNLIGWQEFAELVPERIETVLVPTGTLEAHGVLPNGSDNLAPEAMARELAQKLDALVAPTLNYGVTGSLDAFPGSLTIDAEAYEAFVTSLLTGLARNGFKNVIVLNGHGGPQTAILERVAERVGREQRVRTLVANWWTVASDITHAVFGEDGGHAGNNESAYVQAIVPAHVHPERYAPEMATPTSAAAGWRAYPFPSSIILYQPGQGYPDFDPAKAAAYYRRVNERMTALIAETIAKWDRAAIFR
jgi:creatinine amidohydrolase